jgi:hypothetical protein
MECPRKKCKGSVRVTNSYSAGPGKKTQRRACDSCSHVCVTTILVDESGLSARALAKEMRDER